MQDSHLDKLLIHGSKARLIPVLADTSRENRATSVFLSGLMAVHEFGSRMLGTVGQRVGTRANLSCFTEVTLAKGQEKPDRPDGLIIVEIGKRRWSAIVEAKIGSNGLDSTQIERYLELAKINNIDSVITISNQFAALPTHHPMKIAKSKIRGRQLFHWSWMHIKTQAILLRDTENVLEHDQHYILDEMIRYFEHENSGIQSFHQMNSEWKQLTTSVKSGARLAKTSDEVVNTVGAWHQEQKDLCLILTRKLAAPVTLRLPKAHKNDVERRLRDDCEKLAKTNSIGCDIDIPDAASPMTVEAAIDRRTVCCQMRVIAPGDKKSAKARINWLLRQLSNSDPSELHIRAILPGRAANPMKPLKDVRENPQILIINNSKPAPIAFDVLSITDLAGKFSARRRFIDDLEGIVPAFYERVGENLRNWVPPPPRLKESEEKETDEELEPRVF